MSDEQGDNPELRKFERRIEHKEKQLEQTHQLVMEGPSLLSEFTTEVLLPLIHSLQKSASDAPGRRGAPEAEPPDPKGQASSERQAADVRRKLGLDDEEVNDANR
jgi:hypothetical protein